MTEHDLYRRLERLERIEAHESRKLSQMERTLGLVEETLRFVIQTLRTLLKSPPAAPKLAATFSFSGDSMNAILVATLPSARQDGTALAPTDIASITFQKVPAGSPAGASPSVLETNTATPSGSGLTPAQITFTDTSANTGDSYTCFVTDSAGNVGAVSNAVTDTETASLSPPAAPTLSATFQ